jgi:hypothetical protein
LRNDSSRDPRPASWDPNFTVPWHQHQTRLHKAVRNGRSAATITALLEHGADPNRADARGISPYRYAVRRGQTDIARLFEAHGALPASVTEEDRALGQIALGTAKLADVGHAPDSGLLPWAARREDLQLTTRLLDAGTDIDAGEDMPPLHSPDGGPGSLTLDEITHGDYGAIVELLLAAGAQPPKHATGSEAVREVLRRHGALDAD